MVIEADERVTFLLRRLSEASSVPEVVVLEQALKLWAADRELDVEAPQTEERSCAITLPLGSSEATSRAAKRASRDKTLFEGGSADEGAQEQVGWVSLFCLPDILKRLKDQDPLELAKARLVCSRWSKAAFSTATSWEMVLRNADLDIKLGLLQRLSSLRELTIYTRFYGVAGAKFTKLISAVCSLKNLKSLRLRYDGDQAQCTRMLSELMPLLPRLETLKFASDMEPMDSSTPTVPVATALSEALGAASSLTDLDLSVSIRKRHTQERRVVLAEGLAALPISLTRLRIEHVDFRPGQSLETLRFMPHLEELWMESCLFSNRIGLRCATSLKSLTCSYMVDLKEADFEDILTLQGLEHLTLYENVTSSFARRLPSTMRSLVSLSLRNWNGITEEGIQAIGSLTGLTSLDITAERIGLGLNEDVEPEWLRHLSVLTYLRRLVLSNHNADDFLVLGLSHLRGLPALRSLDLGGSQVDYDGVMKLLPPGLEEIGLSGCFLNEDYDVDDLDSAMYRLVRQCRNLVSIDLGGIPCRFIGSIKHFSSLPRLQQVIIDKALPRLPYVNEGDANDNAIDSSKWLSRLPEHLSRLHTMLSVIRKTRNTMWPHLRWDIQEQWDSPSFLFGMAENVVDHCSKLSKEWDALATH